jgi:glutamyl-tRNA reductase
MHTDEHGNRIPKSNISYGKIIADKIDFELVMLARAGASNYFTCKQVEYAIENQADFIIINFASPRHFDFTAPGIKLTQLPKLSNFEGIWIYLC